MKEIKYNEDGTVTIDGKVFVENQIGKVEPIKTKLQEARERYPAGTRFIDESGNIRTVMSDCHYWGLDDNYIYCGSTIESEWRNEYNVKSNPYIYCNGNWAEIVKEPLHPTIEEIYDIVEPKYRIDVGGIIYESLGISEETLPTQEDAEYILATMQLINIANYYNAKYPSEDKTDSFYYLNDEYKHEYTKKGYFIGDIKFTPSAAKEALSNPNVIEVLQKYFRINQTN